MTRATPEQDLHKAVAEYLDLALATVDCPWTTVGHGPRLSKKQAGELKAMGLHGGWPDIQILHHGLYHGIELKSPKGYPDKTQKAVHAAIKRAGGRVAVCRSLPEVVGTLRGWGIPIRAELAA